MKKRRLGRNGPEVSAIGLGCMGMSEFYGSRDDARSRETIRTALENDITMLDTSDQYGFGHNEELIASVLKDWHEEVFIATKFGIVREPGNYERTICGRPEFVVKSCEASLKRLQRDVIDLYYIHRIDHSVPIEDTIGTMSRLVDQGKVRYIGISEASAATIRRAHAVHPLSAVQTEYSLWTRHVENDILPVMRELGIALVAYSPLGRGFLTGKLNLSQSEPGDFRQMLPRFQVGNYDHNQMYLSRLEGLAREKGVPLSQMILGWVLDKGEDIIPIPGTTKVHHLLDNIDAAGITLTDDEINELEDAFPANQVRGERYSEAGMLGVEK